MSSPTKKFVNPDDENPLVTPGNLDGPPQENLEPDRPVIQNPDDVSEGNLDEVTSENQDSVTTASSCNPDAMSSDVQSSSLSNLTALQGNLLDSTSIKGETPKQRIESYFFSTAEKISCGIFVTSDVFFDLLHDEDLKILIIDARCDTYYKKAHIRCKYICNIPWDIINGGLKLDTIVQLMDEKTKELFESYSFDLIIMLDEDTNIMSYAGSKLEFLRTMLIEDINQKYQILPLILSEGFGMFEDYYPTDVTDIVSKSFHDTLKEIRSQQQLRSRKPKVKCDDACPGPSTSVQFKLPKKDPRR